MTNNGDLKDVKHCPMAHTHPGSAEQVVVAGFMGPFTVFCECGVRGPYRVTREAAIDAWNAMPRAYEHIDTAEREAFMAGVNWVDDHALGCNLLARHWKAAQVEALRRWPEGAKP